MREIELPESLEMEKKLISAMMLKDGEVIPDVSEKLRAEEFYREEHRCIYRAMLTLYSQGIPPDVLTIANELERTGELKKVRRDYLFALIDYEFTTTRAMKYVESIKETAQRRQLMRLGEELLDDACNSQKEISEIIAAAESKLYATTEDKVETTTDFTTLMTSTIDAANLRRKIGGRLLGASTGYAELNRLTCGLKKTDLIIFLLAKNYERLKAINVGSVRETDEDTTGEIVVNNVPQPMVDYFTKRIRETVTFERGKAVELIEQAAKAYAAATE